MDCCKQTSGKKVACGKCLRQTSIMPTGSVRPLAYHAYARLLITFCDVNVCINPKQLQFSKTTSVDNVVFLSPFDHLLEISKPTLVLRVPRFCVGDVRQKSPHLDGASAQPVSSSTVLTRMSQEADEAVQDSVDLVYSTSPPAGVTNQWRSPPSCFGMRKAYTSMWQHVTCTCECCLKLHVSLEISTRAAKKAS